jgi:thioredoxin
MPKQNEEQPMTNDAVIELKADTWTADVEQSSGMMLVYFWAPWCGHCKMFSPTYSEAAAEMSGKVQFAKLNCDEHGAVASQCQITGTPTIIVYINGKETDRIVGGLPKDVLIKRIASKLKQ